MSVALHRTPMSREEFFVWAERQDERYEFNGTQPVAMTGGTFTHNRICQNLWAALRAGLRDGNCTYAGPDAGLATVGNTIRYPDALVTCTKVPGQARLVPDVVAVFEVLSPTSGRIDRIEKVREYQAVPSILRYVILEHASIGLTSLARTTSDAAWTATALTQDDVLALLEIGIVMQIADLYEGVELPAGN